MNIHIKYIVFLGIIFIASCQPKTTPKAVVEIQPKKEFVETFQYAPFKGRFSQFNDDNETHLIAAEQLGITTLASRYDTTIHIENLREITSNELYDVVELTHSIPYLVPEAADLLDRIGRCFAHSFDTLNAPKYKLQITSILRTDEDIVKLRRRNRNASPESAHQYGTTFDISWLRFTKVDETDPKSLTDYELKKILASVLIFLKNEQACYVKHERKQCCFHITVRPEDTGNEVLQTDSVKN